MPKNPVSDPITDQEMAFAHLILSGTMNDRRAAEAVGLNPDTAAYTKAKPRVRAYMIDHRAAVEEKLVDQEAEGLRKLNLGRDQILTRLWELANLNPEATRGIIGGQVKALSMIVAIEGLIPKPDHDRRLATSQTQSAAPPVQTQMYVPAWRRQQHQAEGPEPCDAVTAVEAQPGTPHSTSPATSPAFAPEPPPRPVNDGPSPNLDNLPSLANPFMYPERLNRVPSTTGCTFDAVLNTAGPFRLSLPHQKGPFARGR
jgi:hypothetical protein